MIRRTPSLRAGQYCGATISVILLAPVQHAGNTGEITIKAGKGEEEPVFTHSYFPKTIQTSKQAVRMLAAVLIVLSMLLSALPRPVHANGGIPSAFLDQESLGWASVRNMSSSAFHSYFLDMKAKGYMVVDIEVDEINGQQRVGAVFQRNTDGRGWASWRNLTSAEFSAKWHHYKDLGYRLIDQEAYVLNGKRYYAGVWMENREALAWASWRNLTSSQFSEKFQYYKDNGYIPVDVEGYPMAGSTRYSVVWVKNTEGLSWKLWRNLTSAEFSEKFQAYKDTYRMVDVESYVRDGEQNYAGIWVENKDGRAWQEWRDMTAKEYSDKWLQLRDAGYRVVDYEVYPKDGGYRYAGIWRQNGIRPSWPLKNNVDSLLATYVAANNIPGMSVTISRNNQFVYMRGFGYADIASETIATSRTIYQLASVSKAVGGALGLLLEEAGDLDLDNQTRSYVPAMPVHHTHTLSQTLSNRAGIGHYGDHTTPPAVQYPSAQSAAAEFWDDALLYAPGTAYYYSSFGYTLAAAAMEGATGKPIYDIVEDEVTKPFNLPTLRATDWNQPDANRATLYDSSNNPLAPDNSSWKVLGGGMESSAYDLGRFGMKLLNGSMLSAAGLARMWTQPDGFSNYALGWNTGIEDEFTVVAKNGAWSGTNTYIRIYPEKQIVITVLMNRRYDPNLATTIGQAVGKLLLAADRATPELGRLPVSHNRQLDDAGLEGLMTAASPDDSPAEPVEIFGDELLVLVDPALIQRIPVDPEDVGEEESPVAREETNVVFLPVVTR
ncbi:MAG: serine hydrolase [Caldilineaceae bacterium]|nr:serine hydrolase [Caldilineaceae bacterium]